MKRINFLHIMHNDKFIVPYIEFINKNFKSKEHFFLIIGGFPKSEIPWKKYKNNFYYEKIIPKNKILKIWELLKFFIFLNKFCKNSNKIYFHGLFGKDKILFLFIFRKYLKKSNWIIWGGDLYCYEKRKKGLKCKIWYYIEDYVKKNIAYINTLVPDDYRIAKKYYKVRGKYKKAQYVSNNNFEYINSLTIEQKDEIYIQIGNSSDPTNRHFEIIDLLSKFKDEKIKIYAILSYGDKIYGQKVNEYGKKIFGNKFFGIFDYMSRDKYWNYLKDIDILVFNHQRQQGLGNISMLSFLEKKVYLRNDTSSWEYLTEDIGLKLNSFEKIKNQTFKEFITNNSKGNREKILITIYSNEYIKKIWEENFSG